MGGRRAADGRFGVGTPLRGVRANKINGRLGEPSLPFTGRDRAAWGYTAYNEEEKTAAHGLQ